MARSVTVDPEEFVKAWQTAIATAREQLVAELGDPRPHRLA